MKHTKRVLSLLLCFLLAAALPLAASAEGAPKLAVSGATAAVGEDLSLEISLADNPGLMLISFRVSYDSNRLSLIGVSGVGLSGWDSSGDAVLWLGNSDSSYNGVIAKLNFHVKETAQGGATSVTLSCGAGDVGNHAEQTFIPEVTAGTVTIFGGSGGAPYVQPPAPAPAIPFTDVPKDAYYYDAVAWAWDNGVTTGRSNEIFDPSGICSRGEVVTFLWRAAGFPEPSSLDNPFSDVHPEDYFYKPVLWAVEQGITKGTDATHFTPRQTCSTAHIVTFIYRAKGIGSDGWYQEAGDWANGSGLLSGTGLLVDPAEHCPRGAVVTFLYRWSQRR